MKILKTLGILIIVIIAVAMILMLIMPTDQRIEKTITIKAPAATVYEYLTKLENFNRWSVWSSADSSIKNEITGEDGTLGAINTWRGDPDLSGEGTMEITSLEINSEIEHKIKFLKPWQLDAHSEFDIDEVDKGQTKVTWHFNIATPRPWNIFNLFSNMNKRMGKDFEEGLKNLQKAIETNNAAGAFNQKTYNVQSINFPSTRFATVRGTVNMNAIAGFYETNLPRIYQEVAKSGVVPGTASGLFYHWDEAKGQADMAAAVEVPADTKLANDSIRIIDIAGSKAVSVDYYGAYNKSAAAYNSIESYLKKNDLKQKSPVIEQYMNDPMIVKDTAKWHTRIIFLVE